MDALYEASWYWVVYCIERVKKREFLVRKKKRIVKEKVVKENYVVGGGVGWLAVITYMFTDVRMRDNKKSSMHPWSALWIINKDNQSI